MTTLPVSMTFLTSVALVACIGCTQESERGTTPTTGESGEPTTAAEGRPCGSRGLRACPEGFFCEFAPSADCGRADRPGACSERPAACDEPEDAVCGCDGATYASGCEANRAGVSAASMGACRDSPACARTGCGGEVCAEAGAGVVSPCVVLPEHACYRDAECTRQPDGDCGFTDTAALRACLANPPAH